MYDEGKYKMRTLGKDKPVIPRETALIKKVLTLCKQPIKKIGMKL